MRNGFNGYERLIERVTRPLKFRNSRTFGAAEGQ